MRFEEGLYGLASRRSPRASAPTHSATLAGAEAGTGTMIRLPNRPNLHAAGTGSNVSTTLIQ